MELLEAVDLSDYARTLAAEMPYGRKRALEILHERRSSPSMRLSGGEQQMLAMARILRTGARLLLLDEITEGLAPVIVKKLGEVIRLLKARGYTIVLVEQNFRFAAPLADRHYVLEHGRIVATVNKADLVASTGMLHDLLGV